jgi:hypothetical protein
MARIPMNGINNDRDDVRFRLLKDIEKAIYKIAKEVCIANASKYDNHFWDMRASVGRMRMRISPWLVISQPKNAEIKIMTTEAALNVFVIASFSLIPSSKLLFIYKPPCKSSRKPPDKEAAATYIQISFSSLSSDINKLRVRVRSSLKFPVRSS